MPEVEYIPVESAAAFEGTSRDALLRRYERRGVLLVPNPADKRKRLVSSEVLSPTARQAWQSWRVSEALAPLTAPRSELQEAFPFAPRKPQRHEYTPAPAIPEKHRGWFAKVLKFAGDTRNGNWKSFQGFTLGEMRIESSRDLALAFSRQCGISRRKARTVLRELRAIHRDRAIPSEREVVELWERIKPRKRPGLSGRDFFSLPENDWQGAWLAGRYLDQSRPTIKHAHDLLIKETDRRQRAWGDEHTYQHPTLHQTRRYLEKLEWPAEVLGREGPKAFNDKCAPYISRCYDGLHSNDVWVTDQRQVNVRLRWYGEQLGRIWLVNFLDVGSFKWLGLAFALRLSSDAVMTAAAMALRNAGVPRAVHVDLGKEFNSKEFFGHTQGLSRAKLHKESVGLWSRLGVQLVKAMGRNPQSKTIERWHGCVDDFDRNFPGYTGRNIGERPERLKDEEAQHAAWLRGEAPATPLVTVPQYLSMFAAWCEQKWNATHRGSGKILQGATPNEAFNAKRPAEGFRILTPAEVALHTAEHRFLKVARGGQINMRFYGQTLEYRAPELFSIQRKKVEVIRARHSLSEVTVIYPVLGGTDSCIARAKRQFHWQSKDPVERERLREEIRVRRTLVRVMKRGTEARAMLQAAPSPMLPEISGDEYMAEKLGIAPGLHHRYVNDSADRINRLEDEL
jgi:hypothetical protein